MVTLHASNEEYTEKGGENRKKTTSLIPHIKNMHVVALFWQETSTSLQHQLIPFVLYMHKGPSTIVIINHSFYGPPDAQKKKGCVTVCL